MNNNFDPRPEDQFVLLLHLVTSVIYELKSHEDDFSLER